MNEIVTPLLTVDEARRLNTDERLQLLKERWNLELPIVFGRVTWHQSGYWMLSGVCGPSMTPLEYPLSDYNGYVVDRVYIGEERDINPALEGTFARITFEIAPDRARRNQRNPLLICAVKKSLTQYENIQFMDAVADSNGNIWVEEFVKRDYLQRKSSQWDEVLRPLKERVEELQPECEALENQVIRFQQDVDSLQTSVAILDEKKRVMTKTVDQLTAFVKKRADQLRELDFITEDQYRHLISEGNSTPPEPYLEFSKDLSEDFPKLVSTIQAYLHEQGKLYPRYLLTDFLTLLRTNDFIVLAGLSGSGKTQLVKAFADATHGVAHIIPVKPNWTSAEDLLGYYNPIQRTYLTTPFLEALMQAKNDPERLHLICLDEMNLARVEYYFADFLSCLEDREQAPAINLYSSDEADHVLSEFKGFLDLVDDAISSQPDTRVETFGKLMLNEALNKRLQELLGTGEKEHIIGLHNRLRRLVAGVLNVPATFTLPLNVRILGTVNVDETTHYLAPKVLDRAHVLRFISPLEYDTDKIAEEVDSAKASRVWLTPDDLRSPREPYPKFNKNDFVAKYLIQWRQDFLAPLGMDIGLRTIRQALHYCNLFTEAVAEGSDDEKKQAALNNILLHKILPRFSFDGRSKVEASIAPDTAAGTDVTKQSLVVTFRADVEKNIGLGKLPENLVPTLNAVTEIGRLVARAENNDAVFNYWS